MRCRTVSARRARGEYSPRYNSAAYDNVHSRKKRLPLGIEPIQNIAQGKKLFSDFDLLFIHRHRCEASNLRKGHHLAEVDWAISFHDGNIVVRNHRHECRNGYQGTAVHCGTFNMPASLPSPSGDGQTGSPGLPASREQNPADRVYTHSLRCGSRHEAW